LPGISMDWLRDAPVFAILCAEKNFLTHKAAPFISGIPYHYIDCGIAGEHFVLAATAQGLGTCWIGWFKEKALKKLLNIPSTITVISIISLGFPSTTDSNVRRTERKSIKEILLNIS
ncbi:MAG TPA: nitroreductase family protein, partial [Victivallales bacterium]|nr:nitroreductase family protein [Victivallales bacterium]